MVYGVGINDAGYPTQEKGKGYICPTFLKWRNMLQRCYSNLAYEDASVIDDWKTFSVFKEWIEGRYTREQIKEYHLDKDLFSVGGVRLYSPDTCCLLHPKVNTFLNSSDGGNRGVTKHKGRNNFLIQCKNPFTRKTVYLGVCDNQEDGYPVWREYKQSLANELSNSEYVTEVCVADRLREYFIY